jgi:hypothetical protein
VNDPRGDDGELIHRSPFLENPFTALYMANIEQACKRSQLVIVEVPEDGYGAQQV